MRSEFGSKLKLKSKRQLYTIQSVYDLKSHICLYIKIIYTEINNFSFF